MPDHLESFIGKRVTHFEFANTLNGDDIALKFDGPWPIPDKRLILSHVFTIPFNITEAGLKRFPNWIKPLEHWNEPFLGKRLLHIDTEKYKKYFYLEFDSGLVLLVNRNLVSVLDSKNKCLWTTMDEYL